MKESTITPHKTWRVKIALALNYIVFAMLLNSIGIVILQVQNCFHVSKAQASILDASHSIAAVSVSILLAAQLPRLGCRRAMLTALGIITVVCALMPFLESFYSFILLFAATGAGFAVIKMTGLTTIGPITHGQKEHTSLMTYMGGFFSAGVSIGYFLFAAFIDESNPTSTRWQYVYFVLSGVAAVAFFLLLTTPIDESKLSDRTAKPLLVGINEILVLFASVFVALYGASSFTYVLIEHSLLSWLPTFNNTVLKLPTTLSIQIASLLSIFMTAGRFLSGYALRRIQWLYVLLFCIFGSAILILIALPLANVSTNPKHTLYIFSGIPVAAFIIPLIGLLLAPINEVLNSVILTSTPVKKHGTMTGLIMIFSAAGGVFGATTTAIIFQHFGGKTAFYITLIPMALLSILLVFLRKLQAKREELYLSTPTSNPT